MKKYIYRINHNFSFNSDEDCLIIESHIPPIEIQRILVYICYRFNELVCEPLPCWGFDIDRSHLLDVLMNIYNVKNIKDNFNKTIISAISEIDDSIDPLDYCYPTKFKNVYYIDLFDLWEMFGGERWKEELLPYLKNEEDKIDNLLLEWKKYQEYKKYCPPLLN